MKFIFISIVALWAALFYIKQINKLKVLYEKEKISTKGQVSLIVGIFVATILIAAIGKTLGFLLAAIIIAGLCGLQLLEKHVQQFKAITAVSVPFALTILYSKAGVLDAQRIFKNGGTIFRNLFFSFIIPIALVGLCGIGKLLFLKIEKGGEKNENNK